MSCWSSSQNSLSFSLWMLHISGESFWLLAVLKVSQRFLRARLRGGWAVVETVRQAGHARCAVCLQHSRMQLPQKLWPHCSTTGSWNMSKHTGHLQSSADVDPTEAILIQLAVTHRCSDYFHFHFLVDSPSARSRLSVFLKAENKQEYNWWLCLNSKGNVSFPPYSRSKTTYQEQRSGFRVRVRVQTVCAASVGGVSVSCFLPLPFFTFMRSEQSHDSYDCTRHMIMWHCN